MNEAEMVQWLKKYPNLLVRFWISYNKPLWRISKPIGDNPLFPDWTMIGEGETFEAAKNMAEKSL